MISQSKKARREDEGTNLIRVDGGDEVVDLGLGKGHVEGVEALGELR